MSASVFPALPEVTPGRFGRSAPMARKRYSLNSMYRLPRGWLSMHQATALSMLQTFCQKREACVARLRELPISDMYRPGSHPEFGELTILRQAAYMAYHEQVHLPEIEALCQEIGNL